MMMEESNPRGMDNNTLVIGQVIINNQPSLHNYKMVIWSAGGGPTNIDVILGSYKIKWQLAIF